MSKVLIGMSGGVDSSVAALILKERNYNVTSVTLRLFDSEETDNSICSAQEISKILNINHIVLDFKKEFKEYVLNYFVQEYESGRTPNPCVMCNKYIKFGFMLQEALKLNYDYIATGHYAQIKYDKSNNIWRLKKSGDMKDQSYFLYRLSQEQLSRIIFPLENLNKPEVRELAKKYNLPVSEKKESQDICFIKNQNYQDFVINNSKTRFLPGKFIDKNQDYIGDHKGIINYTVGQRKGLEVALGQRMYVKNINNIDNTVTLVEYLDGGCTSVLARDFVSIDPNFDYNNKNIKIFAKLRYTRKIISPCKINFISDKNSTIEVFFDSPQYFPAPGQSIVFYDSNYYVLGGAIIQ